MSIFINNQLSAGELNRILDFLMEEAYWNRWRSRNQIRQQFETAWKIFAVRSAKTEELLGVVRVSSDGVSYGYIADGFVFPGHRRGGVGSTVLETLLADPEAACFRWMLHTADAQPLYSRFGFIPYGPTFMERPRRCAS